MPQPLGPLNSRLEAIGANRDPALSGRWLALISGRGGREQVLLLDLERQQPVDLPGLNRADAQPVSVSVDAAGERIALVRQLEGRTELVLYRRSVQSLQPIPMVPGGVARQVQLQADGRQLAVQVSRGGIWQVDLVQIP
jgi:Tol biopolymer transport system component